MLTFQLLDFLIVLAGGLILLAGLTLLALRRRNEILQDFLTPEEPEIEKEFFKRREKPMVEATQTDEQTSGNRQETESAEDVGWGTAAPSG